VDCALNASWFVFLKIILIVYVLMLNFLSHAGVKAIAMDAIRFLTMQKPFGPLAKKFYPIMRRKSHA
jgi:hypothetical protein